MLLARVEALEADKRRLAARVAELERPTSRVAMAEAIGTAYDWDGFFDTPDVHKLAAGDDKLNAAIVTVLGVEWAPMNLGHELRKLLDQDLGGFMVLQLQGKGRAGKAWAIRRV